MATSRIYPVVYKGTDVMQYLAVAILQSGQQESNTHVLSSACLPSGYAILVGEAFFTRAPTVKLLPILVTFGALPDVPMCVSACGRNGCDRQSLLDIPHQQQLARASSSPHFNTRSSTHVHTKSWLNGMSKQTYSVILMGSCHQTSEAYCLALAHSTRRQGACPSLRCSACLSSVTHATLA